MRAHRHLATPEDVAAAAIRAADGDHTLGAGALGEAVIQALRAEGYGLWSPLCEACAEENQW